MKTVKTTKLTKNDLLQLYWLDFLREVQDNYVPKREFSGDTWGLEPNEKEFWKWLISNKLTEINALEVPAKEQLTENKDITEGSDGEVEAGQEPKVD